MVTLGGLETGGQTVGPLGDIEIDEIAGVVPVAPVIIRPMPVGGLEPCLSSETPSQPGR